MWLTPLQTNPKTGEKTERRYFQCVTNREYGKIKCLSHSTPYKSLYNLMLHEIRRYSRIALEQPEELLEKLTEAENKQRLEEYKLSQKELKNSQDRLNELEILLQRLFEENVAGRLNDSNYTTMFAKYQKEQENLIIAQKELTRKIGDFGEIQDNSQKWIDVISQFRDVEELTAQMLNALCQKILISQPEKIDGKRTQKIKIVYRFIGEAKMLEEIEETEENN